MPNQSPALAVDVDDSDEKGPAPHDENVTLITIACMRPPGGAMAESLQRGNSGSESEEGSDEEALRRTPATAWYGQTPGLAKRPDRPVGEKA